MSFTALFIAFISSAHAQGIEIGFVIPTNQDEISVNTARILRSRILPAFTAEGIETSEVSSIAIKPELSFTNYQEVEGGMRNIHTSEVQINLICQNLITGTVFASRTFSLQGQGYSADDLVKKCVLTNKAGRRECKIIPTYGKEADIKLLCKESASST